MPRALLLVLAVGLAGCGLTRTTESEPLEVFSLAADASDPVRTRTALAAGVEYTLTVSGTYSVWPVHMWTAPCVGETEPQPEYGAGPTSQPVGLDAAYAFAGPRGTVICARGAPSVREGWVYRASPEAASWTLAATDEPYRPDHVYTYTVRGEGAPLEILIRENDDFSDNYGRLRFELAIAE